MADFAVEHEEKTTTFASLIQFFLPGQNFVALFQCCMMRLVHLNSNLGEDSEL